MCSFPMIAAASSPFHAVTILRGAKAAEYSRGGLVQRGSSSDMFIILSHPSKSTNGIRDRKTYSPRPSKSEILACSSSSFVIYSTNSSNP